MQQIQKEELNQNKVSIQQMDNTPTDLYNKFTQRIRLHLHIILAFSPIGNNLRNQLRMFPALINCCTIDWFQVNKNQLKITFLKQKLFFLFIYH